MRLSACLPRAAALTRHALPVNVNRPCLITPASQSKSHSRPVPSCPIAPHPHRLGSAHQRIAWCHRLLSITAHPGFHDSSPAINTPAAACRPTQLRPHRAAVSTCCGGPRRKCSTTGQSLLSALPCLALPPLPPYSLSRTSRDSPRINYNFTLDGRRPKFQVFCQSAVSLPVELGPPVEGCTLPSWQDSPRPRYVPRGLTALLLLPNAASICTVSREAHTLPFPAPLLPSRTPSLGGTHDNARHHTDGLPCLFLAASACLHFISLPHLTCTT